MAQPSAAGKPIAVAALLIVLLSGPWAESEWWEGDIIEGFGNELLVAVVATLLAVVLVVVAQPLLRGDHLVVAADPPAEAHAAAAPLLRRPGAADSTDNCSICLSAFEAAVDTNCGHTFCANCLEQYWRHGHHLPAQTMRCPMCRQHVNLVLPVDIGGAGHGADALEFVRNFNATYAAAARSFLQQLRDAPMLLNRLCCTRNGARFVVGLSNLRAILVLVFALGYALSPLDLIPEAFFGVIGLVDDVLVALICTVYALGQLRVHLIARVPRAAAR